MAVLRCKMCDGDLDYQENATVMQCKYCRTWQTVPQVNEEEIQNLFNRANVLRRKCEFDKAEQVYERILEQNDREPEAHWGMILCKYGIEYVKDPATDEHKPTCHRTSYDSIVADEDYKLALEHADYASRELYEKEAKEIDVIQKEILALSAKEKPFDVFICYKENDGNGNRTQDSVIANDIYHQLTQEGFKVFYAAITLEDKLGKDYEPIIFAALNSAKVMLAVGTKPEYFNAVWVKNEWSRYLKLIKKDRTKLLIPCYRNMHAYDLPEEFAHLQAQDMSKVGFITDLIRGIRKVMDASKPKETTVKIEAVAPTSQSVAPMLKRVFLCLEDQDFSKASELLENVLNVDPECAEAYIAKLMIEKKLGSKELLYSLDCDLNENSTFIKAKRFADAAYTAVLEEYRNESMYRWAKGLKNTGKQRADVAIIDEAIEILSTIDFYKDSAEVIKQCEYDKTDIFYSAALAKKSAASSNKNLKLIDEAYREFKRIIPHRDSAEQADECITIKNEILDGNNAALYQECLTQLQELQNADTQQLIEHTYKQVTAALKKLGDSYRDVPELKQKAEEYRCDNLYRLASATVKKFEDETNLQVAKKIFQSISDWKDSAKRIDKIDKLLKLLRERNSARNLLKSVKTKIQTNETAISRASDAKRQSIVFRSVWVILMICLAITAVLLVTGKTQEEMDFYAIFFVIAFMAIGVLGAVRIGKSDYTNSLFTLLVPGLNALMMVVCVAIGFACFFIPLDKDDKVTLRTAKQAQQEMKTLNNEEMQLGTLVNSLNEEYEKAKRAF